MKQYHVRRVDAHKKVAVCFLIFFITPMFLLDVDLERSRSVSI